MGWYKQANQDIRLWLDDERPMPSSFDYHAKTAKEAIDMLATGRVKVISLDHDLGLGNGTGYDVAQYIEAGAYNGTLPEMRFRLHTQNPVGREKMAIALQNATRFWTERHQQADQNQTDQNQAGG